MDNVIISYYTNTYSKNARDTGFFDFLMGIKNGQWQDHVLSVRTEKDETKKAELKRKSPLVRVSGQFGGQKDADIIKHSGLIAIDIDKIDNPNGVKEQLKNDPYIYASFISVSGKGLCLIMKIDGSRHLDAFNGISAYMRDTYGLLIDPACKNVSRARYVSYDPHIHINEDAVVFKKYLKKKIKEKPVKKVVFVEDDFSEIVKAIKDRGLNLTEEYHDWLRVCYAIVSEYGEDEKGVEYFDILSSNSSKYNSEDCKKQYELCLKTHNEEKTKISHIDVVYDLAKRNGIETYSQETKDVIRAAASQYKNGVSKEDIAKGLLKFNNIPIEYSIPIIEQVIAQGIEYESENIIEDIIHFLQPYELRKNLITRNVEMNGKAIDDTDINTLFVECKSMFDKATKDLVCSVIFSNKIEQYNPLIEFFNNPPMEIDTSYPNLNKLLDSIQTDTTDYKKWVTKWLVSITASAHGEYSPLVLVFSGRKQGTGKTYWMRYLLPKELRYLFGESDMDNGKDDEILMTKKLIILDDEYGGKSKREEKKLKKITAKEWINVREPYGRVSVDLRRIAVFAGTTNEEQILSDPTGNRRVLPINIIGLNHDKYNDCDKEMLWHEVNHLRLSGYDFKVLDNEIESLYANTENFVMSTPEEDLITHKLAKGTPGLGEWMNITMIIDYISLNSTYKLSNTRVGQVLNKIGYEKKRMYLNGNTVTAFFVNKMHEVPMTDAISQSDAPF